MTPESIERGVDRYARRLWWGEYLRRAAEVGAAALFVFGGVVLVVKLLLPGAWPEVLWVAVGALPVAILVGWLASRRPWTRVESTARLDAALHAGGLLMTLSELPDSAWQARLPQLERQWRDALPRLRPRRFAGYLALPLLFAVGACFVPLRQANSQVVLNTTGQQAAKELEQLLEEVTEKKLLEQEEQKQLEKELKQLAEEAKTTPLTHEKWEAVDALRERLAFRVESATQQVAKAQALAERLALAEASELPDVSGEELEGLQKEFAETLQKLEDTEALSGLTPEELDALQRLSKQARKSSKTSRPGSKSRPGLARKPGEPREGEEGEGDDEEGEDGEGDRQEALKSLRKLLDSEHQKLSDLRGKCQGGQCENGQCEGGGQKRSGQGNSNRPGRGGVTRGRGDAELTFGDESDADQAKFRETVLPKGTGDEAKDEVVSLQKRDPTVQPTDPAARTAAREGEAASGSTTVNRNLSPRHRNVIRKYFDDKE
jgi:hypothetical protein